MTPAGEHRALCALNLALESVDLTDAEREAIRAGAAVALALPRAMRAVREVLAHGGAKRGGIGLAPDGQTSEDHGRAVIRHLARCVTSTVIDAGHLDRDSGRPTMAHVAGRALLAIEASK